MQFKSNLPETCVQIYSLVEFKGFQGMVLSQPVDIKKFLGFADKKQAKQTHSFSRLHRKFALVFSVRLSKCMHKYCLDV